jgi:hypothetical protein
MAKQWGLSGFLALLSYSFGHSNKIEINGLFVLLLFLPYFLDENLIYFLKLSLVFKFVINFPFG